MNQQCKVCGEPAAGFHFGAFTCEGCKSFFGRSYNNLSAISECKNNSECIINKKNRTSCKACRLRKCLSVGMSKSGSRYGRRSNWFKIHCLLQEQQQNNIINNNNNNIIPPGGMDGSDHKAVHLNSNMFNPNFDPRFHMQLAAAAIRVRRLTNDDSMLGIEEYNKNASLTSGSSPSMSSPDSHNSDSSIETGNEMKLRHSLTSPVTKETDHVHNLPFPVFSPFYSALGAHPSLNFVHFPPPLFSHSNSSPFQPTIDTDINKQQMYIKDSFKCQNNVEVSSRKSVESMDQDEDTSATLVDSHQEQPIDLSTNRSGSEGSYADSCKASSIGSPKSEINVDDLGDEDENQNEKKDPLDLTMKS